jgi:hypothetical protein
MRLYPSFVVLGSLATSFVAVAGCDDISPPPPRDQPDASTLAPPKLDAGTDTAAPDAGTDAPSDAPSEADADAGPTTITVSTKVPIVTIGSVALGAKANVTWAAYQDATGAWKALAPASTGTYSFSTTGPKWAVALVCSNGDDTQPTVSLYYRTVATTSLDVPIAGVCGPSVPAPALRTISGTVSNLPGGTTYLSFGYANGTGTFAITPTGGAAPYTQGIPDGTWDFAFGARTGVSAPLTRLLFLRGRVVNADATIDVDMNAAGSFAPVSKNVTVRGLAAPEFLGAAVYFGTPGRGGMDMTSYPGPQQNPDTTLTYATVPAAQAVATDHYAGALSAGVVGNATHRSIAFDFKTPIDVDLTLATLPADPQVTVAASTPYVRLETKLAAYSNAAFYTFTSNSSPAKGVAYAWSASMDAAYVGAASPVAYTMPDLSGVAGWKNAWALPAGISTSAGAEVTEKASALSDGTVVRAAAKSTSITP